MCELSIDEGVNMLAASNTHFQLRSSRSPIREKLLFHEIRTAAGPLCDDEGAMTTWPFKDASWAFGRP